MQQLLEAAGAFPPPEGIKFSYGTAGFRLGATLLQSTVFRVGVLAALRSIAAGKVTGLVITASHNPVADNGVKIVDPSGEMLVQKWELYADTLANAPDTEALLKVLNSIVVEEKFNLNDRNARVFLARDTRPSGKALADAAKKGIEAMNGVSVDMGILTTPQLHWMVRATNLGQPFTEADYFRSLSEAFKKLLDLNPAKSKLQKRSVVVDAANGVGAQKLQQLQTLIEDVEFEVRNSGKSGDGELNDGTGADYVQKTKSAPRNFSLSEIGKSCASIDGDADRLVYFYLTEDKALHLLDGDKMLSLFSGFLQRQLKLILDTDKNGLISGYGPFKFGVVQTAYANGASTRYLKEELGLEVVRTPTGVKYLHEQAKQFDLGLYFEANGHGTVLFGERFLSFLKTQVYPIAANPISRGKTDHLLEERRVAMERLLAVSEMVNQAIGDALSGMLMVETVLSYLEWGLPEWDKIYTDVPSRQLKVKVVDRSVITTRDGETKVECPVELQQAIDVEVEKCSEGRGFVRPSGTEDVVRVYAEAATQQAADELALAVAGLVYDLAGGVGAKPSSFIL